MKIRLWLLAALAGFLLFAPSLWGKKKATPLPTPPHTPISRDYVAALNTANRFLQAWQGEDHEAGLMLLSDSAKQQTSMERLDAYFSPESSPRRAYQISGGRKIKTGRYSFPVVLFEGSADGPLRKHMGQVIAVQAGKGDWVVDKLP